MQTTLPAPLLILVASIGTLFQWIGDTFTHLFKNFTAESFRAKPSDSKDAVIITGASDGIGFEIAKLFARDGFHLIIISHDEQKLGAAKEELLNINKDIKVFPIVKDLTDKDAPKEIFEQVRGEEFESIHVRYLVNNAGKSYRGHFTRMDLDKQLELIDLNCKHIVAMTHLFGKQFEQELDQDPTQQFRIMNLSSVVSFLTTPNQTVYSATKSFIHAFTLGYGDEVAKYGGKLTLTALCPGFTETKLIDEIDAKNAVGYGTADKPERVAKIGYKGMMLGRRYIIAGYMNNLTYWFTSQLPVGLSLKFGKLVNADKDQLKNPIKLATKGITTDDGRNNEEISMQ
jgi:hypothetical protein